MTIHRFRDLVKDYWRVSGYSQKALADALGLHRQVLSRKMSGIGPYQLFHPEIKKIIKTLVEWKAITTQEEVNELLSQLDLKAFFFSNEEWEDFPLSELEKTGYSSNSGSIGLSTSLEDSQTLSLFDSVFYDNLPIQLTSLVGQESIVACIGERLTLPSTRLLSLIGPGGCGKTRLAIEVGWIFKNKFSQGVCFVNLAEINDPHWVGAAISQALGFLKSPISNQVRELKNFLKNQQLLLILDNFEHLTGATGLVEELLKAAPGLKIIVTTRVVLSLYGEKEFAIPALDLPMLGDDIDSDSIIKYSAVRLFVERIQDIKPNFCITGDNAWIVAQICHQLNGLPLALELAAARIRMLTLPVLLERLTLQKLDLLSSDTNNFPLRQQTLRNTLDWSYKLLTPEEQQFFRMLGVFKGSFSIEAVQALWNEVVGDRDRIIGTTQTLDRLGALLKESLIQQIDSDEPLYGYVLNTANLVSSSRFKLLETIREYALEQLSVQDELVRSQLAKLDYYLELSQALRNQLNGPDQNLWLNLADSEYANIRMVLDTSLSLIEAISPAENIRVIFAGLEMCRRLINYWDTRGYYLEGQLTTNHFLATARQAKLTCTKEYAWALSVTGFLTGRLGDFGSAQEILRESHITFVALGEQTGESFTHLFRGDFAFLVGDYPQAQQHYLQAEDIFYQIGDKTNLGKALVSSAILDQNLGNYTRANKLIHQGLQIFQEQGNKQMIANCLNNLGVNAQYLQDYEAAQNYYYKCLQLNIEQSDYRTMAYTLRGLASIALSQGDFYDASTKLVESLQLSHRIGDKFQIGQNLAQLAILNVIKFETKLLENAPQEGTHYLELAAQLIGGSAAQFNQTQAVIEPLYTNLYEEKIQVARSWLGEADFNSNYLKGLNSSLVQAGKNKTR